MWHNFHQRLQSQSLHLSSRYHHFHGFIAVPGHGQNTFQLKWTNVQFRSQEVQVVTDVIAVHVTVDDIPAHVMTPCLQAVPSQSLFDPNSPRHREVPHQRDEHRRRDDYTYPSTTHQPESWNDHHYEQPSISDKSDYHDHSTYHDHSSTKKWKSWQSWKDQSKSQYHTHIPPDGSTIQSRTTNINLMMNRLPDIPQNLWRHSRWNSTHTTMAIIPIALVLLSPELPLFHLVILPSTFKKVPKRNGLVKSNMLSPIPIGWERQMNLMPRSFHNHPRVLSKSTSRKRWKNWIKWILESQQTLAGRPYIYCRVLASWQILIFPHAMFENFLKQACWPWSCRYQKWAGFKCPHPLAAKPSSHGHLAMVRPSVPPSWFSWRARSDQQTGLITKIHSDVTCPPLEPST